MTLFHRLQDLLERSISLLGIFVDSEAEKRLVLEMDIIKTEGLSVDFIVNHRANDVCCSCSRVSVHEYGPVSAWYVNYCLGIARINPLTRGCAKKSYYALTPEHSAVLFKPIPLHCRERVVTRMKKGFVNDVLLAEYQESHPNYFPLLLEEIASTKELYAPVKSRLAELRRLIERVKDEVVMNEQQYGDERIIKFNIFDIPFFAEDFYETAIWNMQASVYSQERRSDYELKQILIKSFMDNLNLLVDKGELQKFTSEDLLEYTYLTLQAMIHAIRIHEPICKHF